jgi:uroporphyrinogen decarboxylase
MAQRESMAARNPVAKRKPLLRALDGEISARPPVWLMRQAGRFLPEYRALRAKAGGFLDLCFTPELAAEVTLQPVRRFGLDAAILFSDILVVPQALGQGLRFGENEGPILDAIQDGGDLARLELGKLHQRLAPIYETVERVRATLGPDTALIGFAGAPWTLACYMIEGSASKDFAKVKSWALGRPVEFARLIDLLVEATSTYLMRQIEAGVEVVQLFDSWAGVLGEAEFDRWCIAPIAAIIARLRQAYPTIPVIAFPRAAGIGYARFARLAGAQALSLDPAVPLDWAVTELRPYCVLQGNLDSVALLLGGAAMNQAVLRILAAWNTGPFIFNLGHGVLPGTPVEHVTALVKLVRGGQG